MWFILFIGGVLADLVVSMWLGNAVWESKVFNPRFCGKEVLRISLTNHRAIWIKLCCNVSYMKLYDFVVDL